MLFEAANDVGCLDHKRQIDILIVHSRLNIDPDRNHQFVTHVAAANVLGQYGPDLACHAILQARMGLAFSQGYIDQLKTQFWLRGSLQPLDQR